MTRLDALRAEQQRRLSQREAERQALLAEMGRRRLDRFIRAAWPIVEPGRPLIWGRHLDAMCEHLEAWSAGQIVNLAITIPPGCTKSRTVGVFLPAWEWIERHPGCRWLFFSNSDDLANRDSMACRRLIESDWYRLHYPQAPKIVTDQNTKQWYENERGGHRQAMSILASVTGKKGDRIVVDDANDAEKVHSEAIRTQINNRWDQAIYDRVIDFKTGGRLLIGQRTHPQDLIGHALETGEFEELRIAEEFEPQRRYFTSIGWTDWRQEEGEFLRPDQFGPEQRRAAISRLGTLGYRAKHQQDPKNPEGTLFKRAWFHRRWRRCTDSPDYVILEDERGAYRWLWRHAARYATADGAASSRRTADPTVISTWIITPRGDVLWMDCQRDWLEIPDQPRMLVAGWEKHHWKTIGIEAVAANRGLLQAAQRLHLPAVPLTPKGLDKLAHAQGALVEAEQGRIWLPGPGEVQDFPEDAVLTELTSFTGTDADDHDDIVDTLSYLVDMKPRLYTGSAAAPTAHSSVNGNGRNGQAPVGGMRR